MVVTLSFKKKFSNILIKGEELVLEPFQRLIAKQQLFSYKYTGFFGVMDTFKEKQQLDDMYAQGDILGSLEKSTVRDISCMIKFNFNKPEKSEVKILCLGAHCDDIEIGCGGTVLKLIENYSNITVYWVVFSSNEQRAPEAIVSSNTFLKEVSQKKVKIKNFQDGFLSFQGKEVKECFEELKQDFSPDLIFTHYREDRHQDHRLISDLTWNTFRNHLILEYEIPKYDGDLGIPNLFVHLDEALCSRKIEYILNAFPTQNNKQWFTEETFRSILRIRGIESNSPSSYAEAFHCRKIVI